MLLALSVIFFMLSIVCAANLTLYGLQRKTSTTVYIGGRSYCSMRTDAFAPYIHRGDLLVFERDTAAADQGAMVVGGCAPHQPLLVGMVLGKHENRFLVSELLDDSSVQLCIPNGRVLGRVVHVARGMGFVTDALASPWAAGILILAALGGVLLQRRLPASSTRVATRSPRASRYGSLRAN